MLPETSTATTKSFGWVADSCAPATKTDVKPITRAKPIDTCDPRNIPCIADFSYASSIRISRASASSWLVTGVMFLEYNRYDSPVEVDMAGTEGTSALKEGDVFTLDQWRTWPEGERWELIGGVAYCMSPAPRIRHQGLVGSLYYQLCTYLEEKDCSPFIAPVDVFLPDGVTDSTETVVQPDVLVVCDQGKIKEDGIYGPPDFIAEILSPSTAYKDMSDKMKLYERSGVREYWMVNPDTGSVFRYTLKDGKYGAATEILRDEPVESAVFRGFIWKVKESGKPGAAQ
jgi:Uma2 family endonuclease